jgi:hypothetical protein
MTASKRQCEKVLSERKKRREEKEENRKLSTS